MEFHFFGIRSLATQCLMDHHGPRDVAGSGEPSTTAWPGKRDGKGARWPNGFLVALGQFHGNLLGYDGDIRENLDIPGDMLSSKRSLGVSENGFSQI